MAVATTVTPPGILKTRVATLTDVENTYSRNAADVFNGPVTVHRIECINLVSTGTKCYAKVYDNVSSALTPGTTKPAFIIPVPAYVADPGGSIVSLLCLDGMEFDNGVSVFAALLDGDDASSPPTARLDVQITA